jgi:hypothetical protein
MPYVLCMRLGQFLFTKQQSFRAAQHSAWCVCVCAYAVSRGTSPHLTSPHITLHHITSRRFTSRHTLSQVSQMPESDMYSFTREQMHARLVVAMGGRAAEEKIFGHSQVQLHLPILHSFTRSLSNNQSTSSLFSFTRTSRFVCTGDKRCLQ